MDIQQLRDIYRWQFDQKTSSPDQFLEAELESRYSRRPPHVEIGFCYKIRLPSAIKAKDLKVQVVSEKSIIVVRFPQPTEGKAVHCLPFDKALTDEQGMEILYRKQNKSGLLQVIMPIKSEIIESRIALAQDMLNHTIYPLGYC